MFKLFVVQFLNSYATLYYVAFMKRDLEGCKNDHCVEDLSYRLILLLVTRIMLVLISITRTGITNANKPLSHPPLVVVAGTRSSRRLCCPASA